MKKSLLLFLSSLTALFASAESEMSATIDGMTSTMSNGIITLSIDKSGRANKLYHPDNGSSTNILGSSGIYFDYTADKNRALTPDKVEIVRLTDDYAEILYTNTTGDLRFSQGYILRKGVSGVYTYVIANGTPTSSSVKVKEVRVCTRLASTFLNGYVDDSMQGLIPSNSEMKTAEKKENTIQDATYRMADGSIYTKYNWAQFIDSDSVHGLMNNKVGVWNIPCSYEWLNGGPMRQELTVHATSKSPITIQMIQGEHLGGAAQAYNDGESQIFGPFFIYVNSAPTKEEMIADAKAKAHEQKGEWPFKWFENALYPLDRATVSGRIVLPDNFKDTRLKVVLAEPGVELIRQGKKYIFWSETDAEGNFSIPNVRKGDYALRAYALSGTITDELEVEGVSVDDAEIDLGAIDWTSPSRAENLIWNIGENNRRADGFNMSDAPRAYGLWESVPANLTYTVGSSDTARDWYFAQCHNGTWTVNFNLDDTYEGDVHLTASVAATTNKPSVAVKVNGESRTTWSFPNNDAAIYRSATQAGRHVVKTCSFPASLLKKGSNTISFTMSGISKNGGVMWDCVKLEGTRGQSSGIGSVITDPATEGDYQLYTPAGQKVGTFDSLENLDLPSGIYIYRRGAEAGKIRL